MIDREAAQKWSKERILLEITELKEEIQVSKDFTEEWRQESKKYRYPENARRFPAEDFEREYRTIASCESDIEFLKNLL
jgi:hypothetical protein